MAGESTQKSVISSYLSRFAAVLAGAVFAIPSVFAEAPEAFVQRKVDTLTEVVRHNQLEQGHDAELLRDGFAAALDQFIDLDQVTRNIMERGYIEATAYQRSLIVQALRTELIEIYAREFGTLDAQSMAFAVDDAKTRTRVSPRGNTTHLALVPVGLIARDRMSRMQFALISRNGENWQMVTLILDNQDIVQDFRKQFEELRENSTSVADAVKTWIKQLQEVEQNRNSNNQILL